VHQPERHLRAARRPFLRQRRAVIQSLVYLLLRRVWGKETRSRTMSDSLCRSGAVSSQTRCRIHGPRHHLAPTGGAVTALKIDARWSLDRRTIRRLSRGRLERELRHEEKPSSGMHAAVGAHRRSWVRRDRHGSVRRPRPCPGPRSSPRPRREVLRAVLLGGSTGGEEAAGLQSRELGPRWPDPAWRRAESALSKHRGDGRGRDIDPEFQELPSILRKPHLGFSLPSRRIRCLIKGSSGGRPGGREPRPPRVFRRSRCHLARVSGPTRKPFHRCRDRSRAAAARNARSAVVKRGLACRLGGGPRAGGGARRSQDPAH